MQLMLSKPDGAAALTSPRYRGVEHPSFLFSARVVDLPAADPEPESATCSALPGFAASQIITDCGTQDWLHRKLSPSLIDVDQVSSYVPSPESSHATTEC